MKKMAVVVLVVLTSILGGCTSEGTAERVLTDQGYVDITFTGYRPFMCGDDYTFHTGFSASIATVVLDKDGKPVVIKRPVTGAVCSGLLKGNSIKID